jgi:hypothetical protein
MADRIHAAVDTVQPSRADATFDGIATQTSREELPS